MTTNYRTRKSNTSPKHRVIRQRDRWDHGWGYDKTGFDIPSLSDKALRKLRLGDHLFRAVIMEDGISVDHMIVLGPVRPMNQFGWRSKKWYEKLEETSKIVHGMMHENKEDAPPFKKATPKLMMPLQSIGYMWAERGRRATSVSIHYQRTDGRHGGPRVVQRSLRQLESNIEYDSPSGTIDYTQGKLHYFDSMRGRSGFVFCTSSRSAMESILRRLLSSNYINYRFEERRREQEYNDSMSGWAEDLDREYDDTLDEPNHDQLERDRELWSREEEREQDAQFTESVRIYEEEKRQREEDTAEDFPLDAHMTTREADAWEREASRGS